MVKQVFKLDAQRATTSDWETLLAQLLAGQTSLHAHFQPIVDMRRGTVTGYEGLPVLSAEPGDQPRELALRAMARDSGLRFTPAACCDGRGRLLGLIPVERLVESLARG